MARNKHSKQQIARIVEEFTSSGKSRAEFSNQHGIHPTTLDSWRRKQATRLIPVKLTPTPAAPQRVFTLTLSNGRRLECPSGFHPAELRSLISIAETA